MSADKPASGEVPRPDQPRLPTRDRFPAQSDRLVAPPADNRTPGQLLEERARYKTPREWLEAKEREKAPAAREPAAVEAAGLSRDLDAPGARPRDNGAILHGHSEFRGQNLDLYSDGTRWVSGDAVRAARAEAAQARADRNPGTRRDDITDIPRMRDLGRNVVGEKEVGSSGDTSHLPPVGQELVEMEDKDAPRVQRFANRLFRSYGDFADAAKDQTDYVHDALTNSAPKGHAETAPPTRHPAVAGLPSHTDPGPGTIVEAALVAGLVMFRAGQAIDHRVRPDRRGEDGDH